MKICNFCTDGGGWIFSACVMVLYEVSVAWSVWVYGFSYCFVIFIYGVFEKLFFESYGCF